MYYYYFIKLVYLTIAERYLSFAESKKAKNVINRSKTMTEESYLEMIEAKVAKKVNEKESVTIYNEIKH